MAALSGHPCSVANWGEPELKAEVRRHRSSLCVDELSPTTYEGSTANGSRALPKRLRDAERSVTGAPQWWIEGVRAALGPAVSLAAAVEDDVPAGYVERTAPAAAAADLIELAALDGADVASEAPPHRLAVQPDPDPGAGMFRLRLYGRQAVELSGFIPVLESFGLTVVEAVPHRLGAWHVDDFGLRARFRGRFDPAPGGDGARLVSAVAAAMVGKTDVDSLNRLVVCAGLEWADVVVLRAYRRYLR